MKTQIYKKYVSRIILKLIFEISKHELHENIFPLFSLSSFIFIPRKQPNITNNTL
jgi:hypothetical protein